MVYFIVALEQLNIKTQRYTVIPIVLGTGCMALIVPVPLRLGGDWGSSPLLLLLLLLYFLLAVVLLESSLLTIVL